MISKISIRRIHIEKTDSTNTLARSLANESRENILITTDFQTAGRGQRGNSWESEQGKNLLFSLIIHPQDIPASQQFILCQHISLALCEVLRNYTNNISIKWPNDIYWDNKKIAGILIEHDIEGGYLARTIIGIGLNVNQTNFASNAPNPISLCQILGCEIDRETLLSAICSKLLEPIPTDNPESLHIRYTTLLYRLNTYAQYRDKKGRFMARIHHIEPDGTLVLEDNNAQLRSYLFKEVSYII